LVAGQSWLNVDASPSLRLARLPLIGATLQRRLQLPPWPRAVRYGNIVQGLPLAPNSCELAYASHVLEHLSRPDFYRALAHLYIYLKPGGTLRVVMPDLEILAERYLTMLRDRATAAQAAHQFMTDSFLGCSRSRQALPQRLREALANHRHQWLWDRASLPPAFEDAGFVKVRLCEFGDWDDPRFGEIEHPDNFVGAIAVQGEKG
jgi:hypothetical protein